MEEKEVKNEVPAPETAKGKEPEKQDKEKIELTPQQIQQRKKMLVYPLMGLVIHAARTVFFRIEPGCEFFHLTFEFLFFLVLFRCLVETA